MKHALHISASLCLAGALTACGGGGEEASVQPFAPGEIVTFAATQADGSVQESHYLMHGVDQSGQLLTQDAPAQHGTLKMAASADNQRPMIALPLENSQQTTPPGWRRYVPFTSSSGMASPSAEPPAPTLPLKSAIWKPTLQCCTTTTGARALPASTITWCFTSRWAKTRFLTRRKRWKKNCWNFSMPPAEANAIF